MQSRSKVRKNAQRNAIRLRKVPLIIALTIIVLFAANVIYFLIRSDEKPRLAQDVASTDEEADRAFQKRFHGAFPIGSSERAMVKELQAEGFDHTVPSTTAVFDRGGFPCRHTWIVTWKASADVLTELKPRFKSTCL